MQKKNQLKFGITLSRSGGLAYCMPNGEYTHKQVYAVDVDPGHYYDYKRHWNEGGIAYL